MTTCKSARYTDSAVDSTGGEAALQKRKLASRPSQSEQATPSALSAGSCRSTTIRQRPLTMRWMSPRSSSRLGRDTGASSAFSISLNCGGCGDGCGERSMQIEIIRYVRRQLGETESRTASRTEHRATHGSPEDVVRRREAAQQASERRGSKLFIFFIDDVGYLVLLLDGVAGDGGGGFGGFRGGRVDGLLPNLEGMAKAGVVRELQKI